MINEERRILGQPTCPNPECGKLLDGFTEVNGKGNLPQEGDLSVCLYCSEVCVFDKDVQVRTLQLAEYEALDSQSREMIDKIQQQVIWSLDRP